MATKKPFKFQVNDVLMRRSSRAKYRPRYQVVIVAQGHLPVCLRKSFEIITFTESQGARYLVASFFTPNSDFKPNLHYTKLLIGDAVDHFENAYKLFRRSE